MTPGVWRGHRTSGTSSGNIPASYFAGSHAHADRCRIAEDRGNSVFKPLRYEVLKAFCFLMHLVQEYSRRHGEIAPEDGGA